ncbi:MAG: hypothetical protein AAF639_14260 [Chloroflexota bacterium]
MNAIIGSFVRQGHNVVHKMIEPLHDLEESGTITEDELVNLLAADLLWQGIIKKTRQTVTLVGEFSWLAEAHDVQRAADRAEILQRIGVESVPVVAGQKWTQEAIELAKQLEVARITKFSVNKESWSIVFN